jgi:hypothetical protein
MNTTTQTIIEQANMLSAIEKIELIDALLATVDKPDDAIDALWVNEAESRLAAFHSGEISSLDLNQVLAKYR